MSGPYAAREPVARRTWTRYTFDGDETVEARIERDQQTVRAAVGCVVPERVLRALILTGGYGRGEGGYTRTADGRVAPFNDYDYVVVLDVVSRRALRAYRARLNALGARLERRLGLEVDLFGLRTRSLLVARPSLLWAETQWCCCVLAGDAGIVQRMRPMAFERLPLSEFAWLLLHRGALLLAGALQLCAMDAIAPSHRARIVHHLLKVVLACGDAQLAARACYHPSYPEKLARLARLAGRDDRLAALMPRYRQALEARFHPDPLQARALDAAALYREVVRLWLDALRALEHVRLGMARPDWRGYATMGTDGQAGGDGVPTVMRHLAMYWREHGLAALLRDPAHARLDPRARLLSVLPMLLLEEECYDPTIVCRALVIPQTRDWRSAAQAFLTQWRRHA